MPEIYRGIDGNGTPFIAWEQTGGFKRAWVQRRDGDKDWASTKRYINVVRTKTLEGGPQGNATDFPIYYAEYQISDEQVLRAFVMAVCAITGCQLSDETKMTE